MEADMKPSLIRSVRILVALSVVAGSAALTGCVMDPPGPSPIYSRLPADQSGVSATAHPLTPEERARYDAIDRQVLAEQNQSMAAEAAAEAWSRYYTPPVSVYGSYYSGGWGHGWGSGVGFGTGWGW
jgi:hypothetical protein